MIPLRNDANKPALAFSLRLEIWETGCNYLFSPYPAPLSPDRMATTQERAVYIYIYIYTGFRGRETLHTAVIFDQKNHRHHCLASWCLWCTYMHNLLLFSSYLTSIFVLLLLLSRVFFLFLYLSRILRDEDTRYLCWIRLPFCVSANLSVIICSIYTPAESAFILLFFSPRKTGLE